MLCGGTSHSPCGLHRFSLLRRAANAGDVAAIRDAVNKGARIDDPDTGEIGDGESAYTCSLHTVFSAATGF